MTQVKVQAEVEEDASLNLVLSPILKTDPFNLPLSSW